MLKYIETDFYNESIAFEDNGEKHTRDLRGVQESDYETKGTFEYNGKEYLLHKHMEYHCTLVIEIILL